MYIHGYVLAVPEERKDDYIGLARDFADIVKDFGALEIVENWEDDVPDGEQTDFRKAVKAEPGERIVLSWTVWPDRATADKAHEGMMADPRMAAFGEMPFDGKRMIMGGFKPIFSYRKS